MAMRGLQVHVPLAIYVAHRESTSICLVAFKSQSSCGATCGLTPHEKVRSFLHRLALV